MTLEQFAGRVYGGMCRLREGYKSHHDECACDICGGVRVVRAAFDELERDGQYTALSKVLKPGTFDPIASSDL